MGEISMLDKRLVFVLLAATLLLFSGCASIPGIKLKAKNKTTTTETQPEGCLDINDNGICDADESAGRDEPEESTTSSTTKVTVVSVSSSSSTTSFSASTTSSTTSSTTLAAGNRSQTCSLSSDCGEPYYSGCTCSGNDVQKTMYKPMCVNGTCKWRSVSEKDECRKLKTLEGETALESESCVPGYSRCITEEEKDEYLTAPEDSAEISDVSESGYSRRYHGYSFRISKVVDREQTKCLDSLLFTIDVQKPDGAAVQREIAWNRQGSVDDLDFGINLIRRTEKGYVLDLWVMEE